MLELAKAFIEHALWPLCVFVLALVFRKPLVGLLGRIETFKGWGAELSTSSAAKQLDKPLTPAGDDLLAKPAEAQALLPIGDALEEQRNAVKNYGGEYPTLRLWMDNIKAHLASLHFDLASQETSELLIRHLAVAQQLAKAEAVYRLIFGSQIAAMHKLNQTGPHPESVIRPYYERARNRSPRFYNDYSFESWMDFLTGNQLVAYEKGQYGISLLGRDFLGWLDATGAPRKPH